MILPAPGNVKSGHYEVRYKAVARLAARVRDRRADDERQHDPRRRASCSARWRRCRGGRRPPSGARRQAAERADRRGGGRSRRARAKPLSGNAYKVQIAKTAVKRAIMNARETLKTRTVKIGDSHRCRDDSNVMDHLTSPKLTPGVHCLNLRHKGMYVTSGPGSRRVHVLRQVRRHGVLVRARRDAASARTAARSTRRVRRRRGTAASTDSGVHHEEPRSHEELLSEPSSWISCSS